MRINSSSPDFSHRYAIEQYNDDKQLYKQYEEVKVYQKVCEVNSFKS